MISKLKRWIGRVAQQEMVNNHPVPTVVTHANNPLIQVFKISNGYLLSKSATGPYRDENMVVIYCATPLDVARQIVTVEALEKLGVQKIPEHMHTSGYGSASLGASGPAGPVVGKGGGGGYVATFDTKKSI